MPHIMPLVFVQSRSVNCRFSGLIKDRSVIVRARQWRSHGDAEEWEGDCDSDDALENNTAADTPQPNNHLPTNQQSSWRPLVSCSGTLSIHPSLTIHHLRRLAHPTQIHLNPHPSIHRYSLTNLPSGIRLDRIHYLATISYSTIPELEC